MQKTNFFDGGESNTCLWLYLPQGGLHPEIQVQVLMLPYSCTALGYN